MRNKLGRNDPCPCGSGKKYKKCCQGTERDPANRDEAGETRVGGAPGPRVELAADPVRELNAYVGEIWSVSANLYNGRLSRGRLPLIAQVAAAYGYDHVRDDDDALDFMTWLTFLAPSLVREQASLQGAIERALSGGARTLYAQLRATLPEAWRIARPVRPSIHAGVARGRPLIGGGSTWHVLADVLSRYDVAYGSTYLGWPVEHGGKRFLVGAVPIDAEGEDWIREAAKIATWTTRAGLWRALHPEVVAAAVEPEYEPEYAYDDEDDDDDDDDGAFGWGRTNVDPATALRWMAFRAERYHGAGIRVAVARARCADDLAEPRTTLVCVRARLLVELTLGSHGPLEDEVRVADLLAVYGAGGDGTMASERLGRFERAPARLLGLDPALLRRLGLDEYVPIGALAAGCAGVPDGPERRELQSALERARTEERWLATFDATEARLPGIEARTFYTALRHGLEALFEPAVLATPLTALPLSKAVRGRVEKALDTTSGPAALTLANLPQRDVELLSLRGIGATTVTALCEAMLDFAREWRYREAGVDARRVAALEARAPEAQAELQGGLEELAALLG